MHFLQLSLAALVGVAQALDVQVVSVGRNSATNATGLKFWPEKITAEPGTMVQFQFWAGNHTVTQSTFDDPCIPIGNVNSSIEGIYSGYMPVEASMAMGMIPTYTIEIKDEKPLWLYCGKAKHCQGGMSMVINENTAANSSRSLDNYRTGCQSATGADVVPVNVAPGGGNNGGSNGGSGGGSGSGNDTDSGSGGDSNNGGGSGSGSGSGGDSNNGGSGSGSGDGSNGGSGSGSGSGDGSGSGSGSGSGGDSPLPTGIQTPAPTGTPTAGSPASTESVVTASAPKLLAPSSLVLAVGAALLLL
ncbi:hypothetical protein CEP54_000621 [Fusarium duplospermum]|uniref:Extracellular serine-rich protein n=1 Tax=Fusarium duplospermum TaxID=1325734 RepID=A0A428R576_9HYPO|nr:hypothetical protein CEP54_000621 [Fusarium duplospermum]